MLAPASRATRRRAVASTVGPATAAVSAPGFFAGLDDASKPTQSRRARDDLGAT